ncbi:hypothetical protein Pme01_23460 [Planosporangium mesophilum]|uniref:Uncharacterized protein n=1 Tax=Planosporangium mesophilum TaxID=689768 RepID=A0A8J3TAH5_9ACTN|nr:hypothetical protein Pme01_23460 [Planosporangium mesophilum]
MDAMTTGRDVPTPIRLRFQMVMAALMVLLGAVGLFGSYWTGSLLAIALGAVLGVATWRQLRRLGSPGGYRSSRKD